MDERIPSGRRRTRCRRAAAIVVAAVAGGGCGAIAIAGAGVRGASSRADADAASIIDVAHVPPLLVAPGETPTLRFDVFCAAPGGDPLSGDPCDAGGDVFVRKGDAGPFRRIALYRSPTMVDGGRYWTTVPVDLVGERDGFSYFAVVRNERNGVSLTVPPAGGDAPQRVLRLKGATTVQLDAHRFGRTREPDARVVSARWGGGPGEVGVSAKPDDARIGPSSFDVDGAGTVTVLDQMNGRIVRWPRGGPVATAAVDVAPAIHDMSVAPDGTVYVLETSSRAPTPVVKTFDAAGTLLRRTPLAERTAAQIRVGPRGPLVRQLPAEQWTPVADGPAVLAPREQVARGRAGRVLPSGGEVVLLRVGNEVRVAVTGRNGVRRSWRVTSPTPLAEVQLAEPLGSRLVVVARVYEEGADEFVALVLGPDGLESRFSLDSASWAEAAPLTRFRLAGGALYRLGSSSEGMYVDRFDLEVTR